MAGGPEECSRVAAAGRIAGSTLTAQMSDTPQTREEYRAFGDMLSSVTLASSSPNRIVEMTSYSRMPDIIRLF